MEHIYNTFGSNDSLYKEVRLLARLFGGRRRNRDCPPQSQQEQFGKSVDKSGEIPSQEDVAKAAQEKLEKLEKAVQADEANIVVEKMQESAENSVLERAKVALVDAKDFLAGIKTSGLEEPTDYVYAKNLLESFRKNVAEIHASITTLPGDTESLIMEFTDAIAVLEAALQPKEEALSHEPNGVIEGKEVEGDSEQPLDETDFSTELSPEQLALLKNLEAQKENIIGVLQATGMDGIALFAEIDGLYTLEELVLPENRQQLLRQQMHMRELEKVAEAGAKADWGPLEKHGIAYGANKVFMYKIDLRNQKLLAFDAPGDYQELDLKTGKWSWPGNFNKGELTVTYNDVMKDVDASHHQINTELEQGLKKIDEVRIKDFAKNAENWTVENTAVLERLGFTKPLEESSPVEDVPVETPVGETPPGEAPVEVEEVVQEDPEVDSAPASPERTPEQIVTDAESQLQRSKDLVADISTNGLDDEYRSAAESQISTNEALMVDVENAVSDILVPAENLLQQLSAANADLRALLVQVEPADEPDAVQEDPEVIRQDILRMLDALETDILAGAVPDTFMPDRIDAINRRALDLNEVEKDDLLHAYDKTIDATEIVGGADWRLYYDVATSELQAEAVVVVPDAPVEEEVPPAEAEAPVEVIEKTPEELFAELDALLQMTMENEEGTPTNDPNKVDAENRTEIEFLIDKMLDHKAIGLAEITAFLYKSSFYRYTEDGELVAVVDEDEEKPNEEKEEEKVHPYIAALIKALEKLFSMVNGEGVEGEDAEQTTENAEELETLKEELAQVEKDREGALGRWQELIDKPEVLKKTELDELDRLNLMIVEYDKKIQELKDKIADLEAAKKPEEMISEEDQKFLDSLPETKPELEFVEAQVDGDLKKAQETLESLEDADAKSRQQVLADRLSRQLQLIKDKIASLEPKKEEPKEEVEFAETDAQRIQLMDEVVEAIEAKDVLQPDVVDSKIFMNLQESLTDGQEKVLQVLARAFPQFMASLTISEDKQVVSIEPKDTVWELDKKGLARRTLIAVLLQHATKYEGNGTDVHLKDITSGIEVPADL